MKTAAVLFGSLFLILAPGYSQNVLPVVITQQPRNPGVLTEGDEVTLSVEATGTAPMQYQWRRNGVPMPEQVTATARFRTTLTDNATFDVVITNPAGTRTSTGAALRVESSRLINISTRGYVGTGDQSMFIGFVVSGAGRSVLVRAVGPTLAAFGVEGTLANPRLRLSRVGDGRTTIISENDDWINGGPESLATAANRVGAFPLQSGSLDSALTIGLQPGNYTVEVSASDGPLTANAAKTGIVLVEVYELR